MHQPNIMIHIVILFFTGSVPLRQLVYRVHPLPESMRPLVWDFGQVIDHTEELYTAQMVRRFMLSPTPSVSIIHRLLERTLKPKLDKLGVTIARKMLPDPPKGSKAACTIC